jgi:hypothetical protein
MKRMKKEEKKPEEQILFPEADVDGVIVKPWSFGMLFKVAPLVDNIISNIEAKNIDLESATLMISWPVLTKIFVCAASDILKVISMTVDISEEEVQNFPMEKGVKLALTIFRQNSQTIKNAFGLNPTK